MFVCCCCSGETVELCFAIVWVQWVVPRMISDLLFDWWNWLDKHSLDDWNLVPFMFDVDGVAQTQSAYV